MKDKKRENAEFSKVFAAGKHEDNAYVRATAPRKQRRADTKSV